MRIVSLTPHYDSVCMCVCTLCSFIYLQVQCVLNRGTFLVSRLAGFLCVCVCVCVCVCMHVCVSGSRWLQNRL